MDNLLPKIKTIHIMLQEMGEQQEAVFRMAFKMHNTTNYEIVTPDSAVKPDLVLVDTDTEQGMRTWGASKAAYPDVPVAMFSSSEPSVTTPYLPKPIKFDSLFPVLRSLSQGGNVFDASASRERSAVVDASSNLDGARKATIHRFNPQKGVLGALKFASQGHQDIAILHEGKPVLIVFPNIQRVLLTVSATELEKLCKDDNLAVVCKVVPDNPQWKEKAKVTIMSCLWQMAIWTAQGRLIYPMTPQTVFTLKRWPNLTRLAHVPESMRLSAFLTKTSVNLNILYKVMPLEMPDILNYLAATSVTGFLATDAEYAVDQKAADVSEKVKVDGTVDTPMAKEAEKIAGPSAEQPRGLLQRLMRKLIGKK
ncbi:response regulator [Neisseria chenwenguii]|uniref:Response regulator n=1 Tax=Neisseria chenwenguii TaxID=1853278 RepID=A0A220S0J8_9NEIS|nr:response regulator [Neisseria chenwenguii]ASK26932.1 response regulator [Neisseria chenwenguii]ROV56732.1 response regulator [Neisseria chenwenguii]